jgi:acetyl-CoA carboxylase biotin carboxylase subunit
VAAGEPLNVRQTELRGAAIECRIYAEDPENNFMPSPGTITRLSQPSGPGVRLDSGIYQGFAVPMDYDPLLAKLAVWGATRDEAIARMGRAIGEFRIDGIHTNLGFFGRVLEDPEFQAARLHTGFIPAFLERAGRLAACSTEPQELAALVAAMNAQSKKVQQQPCESPSRWRSEGREELFR